MSETPQDAPENTVWYGGEMDWFSISLRIFSDNLEPNQITKLLRYNPTKELKKNDPINNKSKRISEKNVWELTLKANDSSKNINSEILNILNNINKNKRSWKIINNHSRVDLFIGMVMKSKNKGIEIDPILMRLLGKLNITIGFDVYYEEENQLTTAST